MVSHRDLGIIAGVSVLGAIAVGVFLGVFLLRKSVKEAPPDSPPRGLPKVLQDKRPKTAEVVIKGKERAEFLSRLRQLRSESPFILRMVTSTRKRFRSRTSLGHETLSDAKTKACKAVVRDLSRVLCLLSIKEEYIHTAPKDWRSLLSWTERLLARYKRQESLKERGEDGYQLAFRGGQGHVRLNKSLFITREEQLKADKDKRRKEHENTSSDKEHQDGGENPHQLQNSKYDCEEFFADDPRISNKKKEEEQNSFSNKPKNEKISKNFLNINKILWLKISSLRPPKEQDLEKGDFEVITSSNEENRLSFDDDDIPSQTFFDHIEAFAFDIENDFPDSNGNSDLFSCESPTQGTETDNDIIVRNNLKNENCRNDHLTQNGDNHSHLYRRKQSFDKANKVSRLKRISSSILSKDRKILSLKQDYSKPRKRRPLKRQKRVERETHSKIIEKYKKNKEEEDPTEESENTENSVIENSHHNGALPNGEDKDFVSVIETPASTPLSNHINQRYSTTSRTSSLPHYNQEDGNQTILKKPVPEQHFSHTDINIIHSSYSYNSKNNCKTNSGNNNNKYYSRCEILTNV